MAGLEELHDLDEEEGAEAEGEGLEGETLVGFHDGGEAHHQYAAFARRDYGEGLEVGGGEREEVGEVVRGVVVFGEEEEGPANGEVGWHWERRITREPGRRSSAEWNFVGLCFPH